MKKLLNEMIKIVEELSLNEGVNNTLVPNLTIRKHSGPITAHSIFKPLFCLNLQGYKEIDLGDDHYHYGPGQYILASSELALTGRVLDVSAKKPFYGIIIDIDPLLIVEVLKDLPFHQSKGDRPKRALAVNNADERLLDAIKRLLLTLKNKEERDVLAKLYIREILFYLIHSKEGQTILQLGLMGSQFHRIKNSVTYIIQNFKNKIDIETLSLEAGMSSSSFHKFFKEVTGLSPIQFQKKTRLMEARNQVLEGTADIAGIAFNVGYDSPSQFSREYSRAFGLSPKADRESL